MIDFSLILPSRERVELLTGLFENIVATTTALHRVECLVAIDQDDNGTVEASKGLKDRFPFVQFRVGSRARNFSEAYYNPMANESRGKYVQLLNDDARFATQGWDSLALKTLHNARTLYPDNIFLGRVPDDLNDYYACFPLLTREALNAVGWAQPPKYRSWGADIHLFKMYSGAGRVVEMPYKMKHLCHHNGTRARDEVNRHMGRMTKTAYQDIPKDIERLLTLIRV